MRFPFSSRVRLSPVIAGLALLAAGCSYDPAPTTGADVLVSNDFESLAGWLGPTPVPTLTTEQAHSGRYSIKVDGSNEFSLGFSSTLGALHEVRVKRIQVTAWVFVPNADAVASLVTMAGNAAPSTKPLLWDGFDVVGAVGGQYNQWVKVSKLIAIPEEASAATGLGMYLWRSGGNQAVYLDDLTVTVAPGA